MHWRAICTGHFLVSRYGDFLGFCFISSFGADLNEYSNSKEESASKKTDNSPLTGVPVKINPDIATVHLLK